MESEAEEAKEAKEAKETEEAEEAEETEKTKEKHLRRVMSASTQRCCHRRNNTYPR